MLNQNAEPMERAGLLACLTNFLPASLAHSCAGETASDNRTSEVRVLASGQLAALVQSKVIQSELSK